MIRIDVLPDDVLLEIFHFYVDLSQPCYEEKKVTEAWQSLVHVSRRWRNLVFQSPRRLNLRLFCTPKTPARDTLGIWPALPLIVRGNVALSTVLSETDNLIAALGQSNRGFPLGPCGLAIGRSLGTDAGATSEADRATALLKW